MSSIKSHIQGICLVLLFLLPGLSGSVQAQDNPSTYQERSFDPNRLEKYRNNPRYKYERAIPTPPPPPKERKKTKKPRRELSAPDINAPTEGIAAFARVLMWILIIAAVIFALSQLMKVRFGKLVKKKSDEAVEIEEVIDVEDIKNMEFEDPIKQAIDAGQFRKAVRLLYLKALRQLQDRSLIQWQREKTNRQYLRELPNRELKPFFQDITFIFEYIWYGEFPVDKDHFNTAYSTFLKFDQALRKQDAE